MKEEREGVKEGLLNLKICVVGQQMLRGLSCVQPQNGNSEKGKRKEKNYPTLLYTTQNVLQKAD